MLMATAIEGEGIRGMLILDDTKLVYLECDFEGIRKLSVK